MCLHHIRTMSSDKWFGELAQTLECDSIWTPSIELPIVLIPSLETVTTDIVPYLNSSSLSKVIGLYPPHSPFYFHGYNGIEAEKSW